MSSDKQIELVVGLSVLKFFRKAYCKLLCSSVFKARRSDTPQAWVSEGSTKVNNYVMCDWYVYSLAACSSSDASSVTASLPAASPSPLPGQLRPLAIHWFLTIEWYGTAGVLTWFNSLLSFYLTVPPVCPKPVSVECRPGRQNKAIPSF